MFQDVVNNMDSGIVVITADLKVVFWNHWMSHVSGVTPEKASGCRLSSLIPSLLQCGLSTETVSSFPEKQTFVCHFDRVTDLVWMRDMEFTFSPLPLAGAESGADERQLYLVQCRRTRSVSRARAPRTSSDALSFESGTGVNLSTWLLDFMRWANDVDETQLDRQETDKLVDLIATCRKLVEQLSEMEGGRGRSSQAAPQSGEALRILVVDDDITTRHVISRLLQMEGHHVVTAENGHEAVSLVQVSDVFDAILMDISMPILDGVSAANQIRSLTDRRGQTPIIAMTSHAARGDRERFLNAGFDDYQSKPINAEKIQKKINRVTGRVTADVTDIEAFLKANTRAIGAVGARSC